MIIVKIVNFLFPFIFMGCQIYYITVGFFESESYTKSTRLHRENFTIPVFVFCVDSLDSSQNWTGESIDPGQYPTPQSRLDRFRDLKDSIDELYIYLNGQEIDNPFEAIET